MKFSNFLNKTLPALILASFFVFLPVISFGADTDGTLSDTSGKIVNPIQVDSIQEFIALVLKGVLKIGTPIVALAVIYCGFLFVQAQGNPEAISKAKEALLYTLIGAGVLLGSWAIAELVSETVTGIGGIGS